MSNDYLWDGSGTPDPEVEKLERLLRPLGDPGTPRRRQPRARWHWALAVAAALCVGAGLAWWLDARRPSFAIEAASGHSTLRSGDWFTARERARVQVGDIGRVDLEPGSRVRLESARAGDYRLRLEQGKLEAFILAPPRSFAVDTPTAVAIDLGCAYTLEVKPGGESMVRVRSGWVAFAREKREVFIPSGARCRTGARFGLGVPVYEDASLELSAAVDRYENGGGWSTPEGLRTQDALTLWHVLPRITRPERGAVFDRLAGLIHIPATVTREQVVRGEQPALDQLWRALDLGDASFWRHWQREL